MLQQLAGVAISNREAGRDTPYWTVTEKGAVHVGMVYRFLCEQEGYVREGKWQRLWRVKGPQNLPFLL